MAYQHEICLRPNQLKVIQKFINSIPNTSKIVEVGVGGGHFSKWMLDQGFNDINCVDIGNYLAYPELKKKFKQCDLSREPLPFKNKSVDGVVAIEVIEHLENIASALKEINRVLKPKGWFLMTIPNISNLRRRISFLFTGDNLLVTKKNDHLQNITDALLEKLVYANFGNNAEIQLVKYPVKFPLIRFNIPHTDLLADNRIYLITKR